MFERRTVVYQGRGLMGVVSPGCRQNSGENLKTIQSTKSVQFLLSVCTCNSRQHKTVLWQSLVILLILRRHSELGVLHFSWRYRSLFSSHLQVVYSPFLLSNKLYLYFFILFHTISIHFTLFLRVWYFGGPFWRTWCLVRVRS